MTLDALYRQCRAHLRDILGSESEGNSAARIIFEDVAGYSPKFIFMNGDREMLPETCHRINNVIDKVAAGEPVQYAVGKARFMGNDFVVDSSVLIPRPETAALVDMAVKDFEGKTDLCVLDIGTGSGCIAISLARALPFSHVTAIDISPEALAVAKENAKSLKVDIAFEQTDILAARPPQAAFDIIVSNPPYVLQCESTQMDSRVLDYEPRSALFVPDNKPLLFYKAIALYAARALRPEGRIYLEINSKFPKEVCQLLENEGLTNATALRDYLGRYRYVTACQP